MSRKVESFNTIVYTAGRETFGTEEIKVKAQGAPSINRREAQICNIRRELKSVRKQWKECAEHEKEGLKAIRDDLRKQLHSLRTAERNRQKRRRRAKARSQFIKSPYNYVKKLLGNPKGGK